MRIYPLEDILDIADVCYCVQELNVVKSIMEEDCEMYNATDYEILRKYLDFLIYTRSQ